MNQQLKNIITRTFLILLSFLACLNCAAKREIKRALDIPVNQVQQPVKLNTGPICIVFVESPKNLDATESNPASLQDFLFKVDACGLNTQASVFNTHPFAEIKPSVSLPFYILHRQFLI